MGGACSPYRFGCRVSLSSLMTYEFAIKKVCASRIAQTDGPHKRALEVCVVFAFKLRSMHTP